MMNRKITVRSAARCCGRITASALAVGLLFLVVEMRLRAGGGAGEVTFARGPAGSLIEHIHPPDGPAELNLGGTSITVEHEAEYDRGIDLVIHDTLGAAEASGWSEIEMDEGLDSILPRGHHAAGLQFRVFETGSNRFEIYLFEPVHSRRSTRVTRCSVDVSNMMAALSGRDFRYEVELRDHYRHAVAGTPVVEYKRPGGSRIVVSELHGREREAAGEVEARLRDAGWNLNPWPMEVMEEFEDLVRDTRRGGAHFWVGQLRGEMCHVVLGRHEGGMKATYRFSDNRPAIVE